MDIDAVAAEISRLSDKKLARLTSCFIDDFGVDAFAAAVRVFPHDVLETVLNALENKQDAREVRIEIAGKSTDLKDTQENIKRLMAVKTELATEDEA